MAPQGRWIDPAAFAATAPPPTQDEYEANRQMAAAQAAVAGSPPAPAAAPSAPAVETPPPAEAPSAPVHAQPSSPGELGTAVDPEQVPADAPRVLSGFLVSFEEAERGVFWPLYQGRNVIGRAGAAEGLDIEIDHPTTSSNHATILASARPGRMKLQDLGSTNGTFLEDRKLAADAKHELSDGAHVRFGGYPTIVKII
jgi:hypothetical protein